MRCDYLIFAGGKLFTGDKSLPLSETKIQFPTLTPNKAPSSFCCIVVNHLKDSNLLVLIGSLNPLYFLEWEYSSEK